MWFLFLALVPVCGQESLTLVHLTDVHVDPFYVTGSVTTSCYCETHESCPRFPPTCTMAHGGPGAGPYGDSEANCASPPALWGSAMSFLSASPLTSRARYVFFTGDFGSAGLSADCNSSAPDARDEIVGVVERGMTSARAALPLARTYGCLGNHDSSPGDYFGSEEEMSWLYGALADGAFGADLQGDTQALTSLRHGGWYTTNLTQTTALIALNTNYWGAFNPARGGPSGSATAALGEEQFTWLNATLASLRATSRSALVIGHIPPKEGSWLPGFYTRYRALLTQHHPVVLAAFFGHNHVDEFTIVRACVPSPPTPTPYPGPWIKTCGISWCSGGNLPVGDVWGRGFEPHSPHCPYLPPANGTAQGRIALCEGVCGGNSSCAGFTWYPDDGSPFGACCFRTATEEKPVNSNSSACCFEKVGGGGCGGSGGEGGAPPPCTSSLWPPPSRRVTLPPTLACGPTPWTLEHWPPWTPSPFG